MQRQSLTTVSADEPLKKMTSRLQTESSPRMLSKELSPSTGHLGRRPIDLQKMISSTDKPLVHRKSVGKIKIVHQDIWGSGAIEVPGNVPVYVRIYIKGKYAPCVLSFTYETNDPLHVYASTET